MREILLKRIYLALIAATLFAFTANVTAQDVHFSQPSYTPLLVNPALTGIFDGKARITNSYRSQWSGLGKGYKTEYISIDAPVGKQERKNNYFGVGGMIYQDWAGTAGFKSTIIEGTVSYTTCLDDQNDHFISIGFQGGLNQQSLDLTKATWDSQWNGDIFDPSLSSFESIALQQFTYLDFNAGMMYYYIPDGNNSLNFGAAMSHIGSPNVSFFSVNTTTPLERKITLHGGGIINIDKDFSTWIEPKVIAMFQGPQKEILIGGDFKNKVQFKSKYTSYMREAYFYGGAMYRFGDALVISARFEYNTLGIGLSYDINTSSLSRVAGSANAIEINLSYVSYVKRGTRAKNYNKMPRFF